VEFGVTFSVRKDAYLQAKRIHARNRNESAYGYAFRGALDQILRDEIIRRGIADHRATLSFIIESGCANQNDLRRIFEELDGQEMTGVRRPCRTARACRMSSRSGNS